VTSLSVTEGARPVPLVRAAADINEKGRAAALVVDSHASTGWGVTSDAEAGREHFVIVAPAPLLEPKVARERPLPEPRAAPGASAAGPTRPPLRTLTFTLAFHSDGPQLQSSLGRFRLSATTARRPFAGLPVPVALRQLLETAPVARTPEQKRELAAWFRPLAPSLDAARDRARAIQRELDEMKIVTALVMQERAGFERPSTLLRNKGSFTSPGERIYAAVPAVFGGLPDDQPPNRLGLARWVVSDSNPLTARVTVNRLWETLFGRGLVASLENFGKEGERPSHPKLLDWLAVEFMEKGWSQKAILREMVSSATYRQSSAVTKALGERDPENRLLARGARYRFEAEMVRPGALGGGPAEPEARRPERLPAAARGCLECPLQPDEMGDEHWGGPVPAQPLHVLPAQLALPEPRDLRRAEPRAVHAAPRAHQHSAAGAYHTQRSRVRGGVARARAPDGAGGRSPAGRADRVRAPDLHGPTPGGRGPRNAARVPWP